MIEKIKDNKKNMLIIIFGILALIVLYIRFFSDGNKNDISVVKSSSKFYTVSSCVNRYLNYLYNEDSDNLLVILDKNYKRKNGISSNNIFKKISKLDSLYSFEAREMYEQVINDDVTKYYVRGFLISEGINYDYNSRKDFYIIVNLDTKNSTYSISPYDGDIFINGDLDE